MKNTNRKKTPGTPRKPAKTRPPRWRHILVPVDFSSCSRDALRQALDYAARCGARVTLLHVVRVDFVPSGFGPGDDPLLETRLIGAARRELEGWVTGEARPGVKCETLVRLGRPATEIILLAKAGRSDLIVMGTHGRSGMKRALAGSVAENVVRHAACPVLVVPGGA